MTPDRANPPQAAPGAPVGAAAKSLFSQHYLEHRLQEHPEWQEDLARPYQALRELYDRQRDLLPGYNEAQTEDQFIRPALRLLGYQYLVQTGVHRAGQVQRPDYALYADEAAKERAAGRQEDERALYASALAIADAKYWDRPLNERRQDGRDAFTNANPSFQMVNYLIGTGVDWGILTNGRLWRLYYRLASSTATEFYEVDLERGLGVGEWRGHESLTPQTLTPASFKYFWLFFRRDALVRDAQGRNFLERVREGSATYARVVGDKLKALVFEQVFPSLARGFAQALAAQGEDAASPAALEAIYQATLSLLYKLLFLLNAEARALLPVDDPGYREYSVTQLAREVAAKLDRRQPFSAVSTQCHNHLLGLFQMVDSGDPSLGLPRYNGGLFHLRFADAADRARHAANAFLMQHPLPDAVLAPALDALARVEGEAVDYRYLGVRHLGAIYEGLLEHRLVVEDAASGRVGLATDRGERKATGSYYTPDYVVKYIVQHTLEPIAAERAQRFAELMARCQALRHDLQDGRRRPATIQALHAELEQLERRAIEALLDIKLCDPAMGSGHFLVEAVDFLTDRLIEVLNRYPEDNPVLQWLEEIRGDIARNLEAQGIMPGGRGEALAGAGNAVRAEGVANASPLLARLDDTQLLMRAVMKRCIYGVDLNPMAVELAKVSLWLHSFTVGAPLSFLDHHLRCGNSLIGAMAREAEAEMAQSSPTGQTTFLTGPFSALLTSAEVMRGCSALSDATFNEVEQSEQLFQQYDVGVRPYKKLLDIYVARHFGVERADEFLRLYGVDALKAESDRVAKPHREVLAEVQRLYQEKRFFHWDLEFPEAFIDLERGTWKENPGFDAVVGNPPWGVSLSQPEQAYIRRSYRVAEATPDSFATFTERGIAVLSLGGLLGYIVPSGWQTGKSYVRLRELIVTSATLKRIVNLPYDVFPEAYVDSTIMVLGKGHPRSGTSEVTTDLVLTLTYDRREKLTQITDNDPRLSAVDYSLWFSPLLDPNKEFTFLSYLGKGALAVARKVVRVSEPIGKTADIQRGITPFSLEDQKLDATYEVALDGEVRRYSYEFSGRKFVRYCSDIAEFKPPRYFRGPRIILRELISRQFRLQAVLVSEDFVSNKSHQSILVTGSNYQLGYLLAILNSRLLSRYHISGSAIALRDDFPKIVLDETRNLPIRRILFTTPPEERARHLAEAVALYEEALGRGEAWAEGHSAKASVSPAHASPLQNEPLLALVAAHLAAQPERADVVHDLLAHLAERMIALNKAKQAEMKGFLGWLERELGAPLGELVGKARVHNYLGDYQKGEGELGFGELLDTLRKNARRLRADPGARAFQERLEGEYAGSLGKLRPIKARLAATDRLIDAIVYQLYGLTEEEIRIVEGEG
jgi:hypothetical protein